MGHCEEIKFEQRHIKMDGDVETKLAPTVRQVATLEDAIEDVLINAFHAGGIVRGIHEACKQVIIGLCKEANIPCVEVEDAKELGRWAGLCKLDMEGNAKNIVNAGVVCVTDFGLMKK